MAGVLARRAPLRLPAQAARRPQRATRGERHGGGYRRAARYAGTPFRSVRMGDVRAAHGARRTDRGRAPRANRRAGGAFATTELHAAPALDGRTADVLARVGPRILLSPAISLRQKLRRRGRAVLARAGAAPGPRAVARRRMCGAAAAGCQPAARRPADSLLRPAASRSLRCRSIPTRRGRSRVCLSADLRALAHGYGGAGAAGRRQRAVGTDPAAPDRRPVTAKRNERLTGIARQPLAGATATVYRYYGLPPADTGVVEPVVIGFRLHRVQAAPRGASWYSVKPPSPGVCRSVYDPCSTPSIHHLVTASRLDPLVADFHIPLDEMPLPQRHGVLSRWAPSPACRPGNSAPRPRSDSRSRPPAS